MGDEYKFTPWEGYINLKMFRVASKVSSQWGRRRRGVGRGVERKQGCSTEELGDIILAWWRKRCVYFTMEEEMVLELETELFCRNIMWACPVC